MAAVNSFQVTYDAPVQSHGSGSNVKVARFQVTLPITANLDTIAFGRLPDYAVPIEAMLHTTSVLVADVGITGDGDGFFDGVTTVANTPLRTVLSTLIGKNVGLGGVAVTGLCNGAGTAGVCNLIIHYVIEDAGVGYPFVAAV